MVDSKQTMRRRVLALVLALVAASFSAGAFAVRAFDDNRIGERLEQAERNIAAAETRESSFAACKIARERTIDTNELAMSVREFLISARDARRAAFERDGFEDDRTAANDYDRLAGRIKVSSVPDCLALYPQAPKK